jgi:hypothetical protein
MIKFKIHGSMYEPSSDGADKSGYIHFWDVIEAPTAQEAMEMAWEDYGDYNTLEVAGTVTSKADEKSWLANNPD